MFSNGDVECWSARQPKSDEQKQEPSRMRQIVLRVWECTRTRQGWPNHDRATAPRSPLALHVYRRRILYVIDHGRVEGSIKVEHGNANDPQAVKVDEQVVPK